jgi:hypothetical protein
MKRLLAALLFCALPLAAGTVIKNPYTTDGNWYIGQLHFHTKYDAGTNATGSDGTGTPAAMETAYHNAGYDFIVCTDHRSSSYTGGGLTADPAGTDLLWILGEEVSTSQGHLGCIGIDSVVNDPYSATATQTDIDGCRTNSGIACINHPAYSGANFGWWAEQEPLKRFSLIEVLNGKTNTLESANEWPNGVDLADEYRQHWWVGVDDAHNSTTDLDKWCVVVQTASGTIAEADILSSLDSGNFYIRQTATGPNITGVTVSGTTITVTLASGSYTVNWYKKGKRLVETDSSVTTTASYTAVGTEGYIFAEISDGTNYAYTQPLFIINDTDLSSSAAASAGTAANLIDNDQGTTCDFGAATGNFTIDLGAAKQVNGVRIYWNVSGTERWNYKIEESSTGAFGGEETEQVRTTFSNRASTTLDVFDCWSRYIRVTITGASVGSSNASVKEVEVFDASPEISEYYIQNVTGNDTATGFSTSAPLKTINTALLLLRPRDRLNFINSGTAYTRIKPDDTPGNYALGKHPGAKWYLRGLNFPTVTKAGDNSFNLAGSNFKYIVVSGFSCTGGTTGITITAGTNIEILGNKVYGNSVHGITSSLATTETTIAYNLSYSNGSVGIRDGADAGTNHYFYNNVSYGNSNNGFSCGVSAATTCTLKNNISSTNGGTEFSEGSGTVIDSNNSTDGTYSGTWAKTNNQDVDPQFVNAAAGDFRLKATSPLLRKGVAVGLTTDIAGNTVPAYTGKTPDIGAYENRPGGVFIF